MPAPIVFLDIAGPADAGQRAFYAHLFDWQIGADGRFSVPVQSPMPAALRSDPAEKLVYIGVEDVAATLDKIAAIGGTIDVPRFEVPGSVILGLFLDPAGNRMGLVEIEDGQVKVPSATGG
ncbi:VOC family protein [Oceanomicrobium pacificus]|uniref:VOC domain-containing protein n=1 Tax=Oceanomicrobium pacificus TaxID=2692916 RepID=A0A6B0TK55_9RHOB|nr:hypothetical protein [Oceanomicrobium pacificus]MXU64837.1 hypothetical protein [Oceanomicrobium pacificus]